MNNERISEDNSTSLSNLGVWLVRNSAVGVALPHVITCEPPRSTWRAVPWNQLKYAGKFKKTACD